MPESLRDVLEAHTAPPKLAPRAHPNQWAAALQRGEHTGEITTNPIADRPDPEDLDWSQIFAHWNLDPADWEVIDGTVEEEHITHDAGGATPQGLTTAQLSALIREAGREPVLRDTLYTDLVAVA